MKSFFKNNYKGKLIIAITLLIVALATVSYSSFFVAKNNNKEYKTSNTELAFYYNDSGNEIKTDKIPDGYILETYSCSNNNVKITWNYIANKIKIKAKGASSCKVYLKASSIITNYILTR